MTSNILANGNTISPVGLGYLDNVTSNVQSQINTNAPSATPTLTNATLGGTTTTVIFNILQMVQLFLL